MRYCAAKSKHCSRSSPGADAAKPKRDQGSPGAAVTVFLLEGEKPPPGYVLVSTFAEDRKDANGPGGKRRRITMWQKR